MADERVDQIVQFALARAAHEDDWHLRELGPIHLIKYVYLADLAYARTHSGETFTGTKWIFFHFGPWSAVVHDRLDQAAEAVGAKIRIFELAGLDKDGKRYSIAEPEAEAVERRLDRVLPTTVTSALSKAVRRFGSDTDELLHHVYQTAPMLRAAPNEALDFSLVIREPPPTLAADPQLSRKQEKKLEATIESTRLAFKERLASLKSASQVAPKSAPPRYDEVFAEGVKALDADAEVEGLSGEVTFPADIWTDPWRDPHGSR